LRGRVTEALMAKRQMEDHDREAMVDAIRCRREERGEITDYAAPGAEQRWRARDLVDIHWKLTGIETPSGSYNRIMSCIIGHANPDSGVCYPRQSTIGIETGYSRDTVKRVIDWWTERGFLKTESRGLAKALAYHPQWDLFELHWIAVADDTAASKENLPCRIKGQHDVPHQGAARRAASRCSTESQRVISKNESHPERAHPPSAADAEYILEKEKGFSGRATLTPDGLTYAEAHSNVSRACTPFDWDHLTEETFDAAVAVEMESPGRGVEAVKAVAQEAGRARRKEVVQ
jgi:hypothetical protein